MPSKKRKDIPCEHANLVDKTCYIFLEIWDEIYSNAQYANIYPRNVTEYYVEGKYGIDKKGLFIKLDKTKWGNCEFYINEKITIEHAPIERPLNRIELTYEMYEKYELPVKISMEKKKTAKKRKTVPDSINNSYKRMKDLPDVVLSAVKYQMSILNQGQTEIVQKYWGILIMTRDHPNEKENTVFSAFATQGIKQEHFEEQLFEKLIEYKINKQSQPEGGTTYRTYLFSGFKTATMCPSCYCAQRQLLCRLGITSNNFFNYWITNSRKHSPTTCIKDMDLYNDLLLFPLMVGLPSENGFSTTFDTPAHDIPLLRSDGHEQCCVDYERTLSNGRNTCGKTHKFSIIGIPLCTESSSKKTKGDKFKDARIESNKCSEAWDFIHDHMRLKDGINIEAVLINLGIKSANDLSCLSYEQLKVVMNNFKELAVPIFENKFF